jgi:steroid delta-isomerase-like uncharacterized protein
MDGLEQNKRIVRRYYDELLNGARYELAEELFSEEFLSDEQPVPGMLKGRSAVGRAIAAWHEGFPDFREEVEVLLAEKDLVAARFRFTGTHKGIFLNIAPTGRAVWMSGIEIFRLRGGRITEVWYSEQLHELLEQLGAITPVESGY